MFGRILEISKKAQRDFKKLDLRMQKRVFAKIDELTNFPDVNCKKLTDISPSVFRMRCGDYRILFSVGNDKIRVVRIKHRKEIYGFL